MLADVIEMYGGKEVTAIEVYSDMFKLGENEIQKVNEPSGSFKANPLGYMKMDGAAKGKYRILFEDTFAETLAELQQSDFAIMNGITYFGRKNTQENASKMYALILDLDGVTDEKLNNFLYAASSNDFNHYPLPNYIILSGHGVHLYYVFEEPLPLYPNIKLQLKELKYALTKRIWNRNTTELYEKIQYQGINQGFRVIGGKTKIPGVVVRAFQINKHPYSINQLNEYVPEDKKLDQDKIWKESKLSLAAAKKKYPLWYERRILNKEPKGTWTCKSDLYYWWLRQIKEGAIYGHRYFCIMCLSIYAVKSGIKKEQLEADAYSLIPFLNSVNADEPFTEEDVKSALECFDERYKTFPRTDIERLSAIKIPENKRNYRKQNVHLKIARFTLETMNEERGMALQGRPSKEDIVKEYFKANPGVSVTKAAEDLGVSRTTIYKHKC